MNGPGGSGKIAPDRAVDGSSNGRSPLQLAVLSGKGGTGKTSVAAGFASLARDVVLADCDVDAANLHLLLAPKRIRTETFFAGKQAVIEPERCTACGECAAACRFEAIAVAEKPIGEDGHQAYVVDPLACEGCGLCARVCPANAVTMIEPERGEYYVSGTRHAPLVHARLAVGGQNSGKLVTLVRNEALTLAREGGLELVLVDGPPGVGCPAIASVTGADLVLLVCEPTVAGEHDLERIIELVKGFGAPLAVCINKRDLDTGMAARIRRLCEDREVPVAGELSYDLAVVDAQLEGKSIVETEEGPVAHQMREMWDVVSEMLKKAKG